MAGFGAFDSLLDGGSAGPEVSPERLEIMGRRAATNLVDKGIPLNETLAKEAAAVPGMNGEHIKRACEFANTQTFLAMHKAATGDIRAPEFDMADPNTVLQDLGDGAAPTQITQDDIDYATIPSRYIKSAGARTMEKAASSLPKLSGIKTAHAHPLNRTLDLRTKLAHAAGSIERELHKYERYASDARGELVAKMAQALEEGATPAQLSYVCLTIDKTAASVVGEVLGEAMSAAKIPDRVKLASVTNQDFEALLGLEVDNTSPVARSFGALIDFQEKVAVRKVALQDIKTRRNDVETFLQTQVR